MLLSDDSLYIAIGTTVVLLLFTIWWISLRSPNYPPGPPRRFLIGNLKDIPSGGNEWEGYGAFTKKYGSDVIYLNALGSHLLVLNSFEAARELLDKRGSIYSSRPRFVVINELRGWAWNVILMPYGKKFQAYRRVIQQEFQPSVVADSYRPAIWQETISLLDRLFKTPQDLHKHLKQLAGATIMMVTYGHQVMSADDEFVALAEAVREHGEKTPGSNLVDVLPFLKYVPAWLPGAGFQREAMIARKLSMDMRSIPFHAVKAQMAAGTARPSIVSRLLQDESPLDDVESEEFVMNCGGVMYSAGADTTVAALLNFVLAMTWYPHIQECAQKELDTVIGRERLPTFNDRSQLPYISNVVKETLRWKAVAALGVPHATSEDDQYRGWHIPQGTTVLANIHAILHDESVYKEPHEFNPDRFIPSTANPEGEPDPTRASFGFGRRICPGRFFADDILYLAIATMLHVFKISNTSSKRADVKWRSGLVGDPSPFPFSMTPRFQSARDLMAISTYHGMSY